MPTLWDRERNKRTQAKKERANQKSIRSGKTSPDDELDLESYENGILATIHSNRFEIRKDDELLSAVLDRENALQEANDFAIGDQVIFQRTPEGTGLLIGRKERTSFVTRSRSERNRSELAAEEHVLSANVDLGIITVAVQEPEFHQRFIDRYLAILQAGNVQPVICLTKTDLTDVRPEILEFYQQLSIPIIRTSFLRSEGIESLKDLLRGKTAVFLGQSGVGKSSLMKALIPDGSFATGAVSKKTGKGQHTTTGSSLFKWDENSYIIDTPGIRSLGIEQLPKKEIRFLFPEFDHFVDSCRFSDCLHVSEPECAIKQALTEKNPAINIYRYESYLKMLQEV